ncbi:hypothetical protein FQN54_003167 [Arachnomyces sp. PD_36]|nr:hypothetical protein FQN54_003167 [Arachnomyces sp. PD_36]
MPFKNTDFCFPVKELSSDSLKLVEFDPSKHATPYFEGTQSHPEVYRFMSTGPYSNPEEFTQQFYSQKVGKSMFCFAIIDKKKPPSAIDPEGEFAGMVSYQSASFENQSLELGYIIVLPPFQRTHVTTHTIGLMLRYALDSPEQGGLGLRRVIWKADTVNPASVRAASRMGFRQEGVLRWERVAPDAEARGKAGNKQGAPPYGNQKDLGRDVVLLSMCWDDWLLEGKREFVRDMMER